VEFLKWGIAGLGGLLCLAGGVALFLRRQVRWKTAELEQKNKTLEREIAERLAAEEELRQEERLRRRSQKMEAIGTMAGGIAHDFNNILQPIIGYVDLLDTKLSAPGDCAAEREYLAQMSRAGGRARELVGQILTLSRQRETKARPMRLELVVAEVVKLIRVGLPKSVEQALCDHGRTVRLPGNKVGLLCEIGKAKQKLGHCRGAEPGLEAIATALPVPPVPVGEAVLSDRKTISLDDLSVESHERRGDKPLADDQPPPDEVLDPKRIHAHLNAML
jgi:signal transduction histidine kinase